jgi:antirestriction protein ArdC
MTTENAAQWSRLLIEAVTKPGILHAAYSYFHNYSLGNQLLAISQCYERGIEPGPMATFLGWKERGRHVRKGERALTLCMPIRCKSKEDDGAAYTLFAFKPKWFVLAQTEGAEQPPEEVPAWSYAAALDALGITETPFDITNGNIQGFSHKRSISVSPIAVLPHKTRFHEMAHVLLGHTAEADFTHGEILPRDLRETEAECVALICCETLGLPGAEYSRGYIQKWLEGKEVIPERCAQRIFTAADSILKAGTPREEILAA